MASRMKLVDDVLKLRELDAALRADGVNVPEFAERWLTTTRAVHRMLDAVRELVGPTEAVRGTDLRFKQRYVGKPEKLFAN